MTTRDETPKFKLHYMKHNVISMTDLEKSGITITPDDIDAEYVPFHIDSVQNYNPIYNIWFSLNATNYNRMTLNSVYQIVDMNTVLDSQTKNNISQQVFIKYSPLLDPVRYMVGKYDSGKETICNLPTLTNESVHPKLQDPNNMAYVDGFFSYLSSQLLHTHNCMHGIDYYGSFTGIQEQHKMDITDDYEYLQSSIYFKNNINTLFKTSHVNAGGYYNYGSHANKPRLQLLGTPKHTIDAIAIEDINEDIAKDSPDTSSELIYTTPIKGKQSGSFNTSTSSMSSSSSDNSNNSDTTIEADDDDDDDNDDDDESVWDTDESDCSDTESSIQEETYFAYIKDFPVHCIALQKCNGTFDTLLENNNITKEQGIAALMQIVMTLLCYQTAFQFTHNDLHTNNIMYIDTEDEFVYYTYNRTTYKVPTYGKIIKLIDFGRAIYNYNGHRFCSDSFAPSGDASTQYNCEPYMDDNKPRLDPNYSFDLCRLGCSLYDFIIDDDDKESEYDELQQIVHDWCLDDNNKNILYKQNGEERYPNFKLYKMIARTVHNKTPAEQLSRPVFNNYVISSNENIPDSMHMNIDLLPEYYTKYM
jgi:hypothetical protein